MALDAYLTKARRQGDIGVVQAWSVLEQLSELPTWSEPGRPSPASRPGRKRKDDVRLCGALLSLYEEVTGRRAGRDKDTIAFVQSFMAQAGPAFAAAERGSPCPPRGKLADKRWAPLGPDAFRKRLKQFEDAKDPARARRLMRRAEEERKE